MVELTEVILINTQFGLVQYSVGLSSFSTLILALVPPIALLPSNNTAGYRLYSQILSVHFSHSFVVSSLFDPKTTTGCRIDGSLE
jgi:hypothetical protein